MAPHHSILVSQFFLGHPKCLGNIYQTRHDFHFGPEIVMPCPVFIFVTIICLSEDCGRQKPHETSCNKHLIEAGLIQSRYIQE